MDNIDTYIAHLMGYTLEFHPIRPVKGWYSEGNHISDENLYRPSTNIIQALEVAEAFRLTIDLSRAAVTYGSNVVAFTRLELLPLAICEVLQDE